MKGHVENGNYDTLWFVGSNLNDDIGYRNWRWRDGKESSNASLNCRFDGIPRKLGQKLDVLQPIPASQLRIGDYLEDPAFGVAPQLGCRKSALVLVRVDSFFRFALDKDILTIPDDVKIWRVFSSLSFVLVRNGQGLLHKPLHILLEIQQVDHIALDQRLEGDHALHLEGWKVADYIATSIGDFSDRHRFLLFH